MRLLMVSVWRGRERGVRDRIFVAPAPERKARRRGHFGAGF